MSKRCELTGVGPLTGNQVSHANNKTRTRWLPNLKDKRYFISELGQVLSIRLSTRAIRTIDKQGGISNAIRSAKPESLSPRLQAVARKLNRTGRKMTFAQHPAQRATQSAMEAHKNG